VINDVSYIGRQYLAAELSARAKASYDKIADNKAILIVMEEKSEILRENISNYYFVESVQKQNKEALVQILSEQYGLQEAESLLSDLNLPVVLEIYFGGDKFGRKESELFRESLDKEEGIFHLIYSEDLYEKDWRHLSEIAKVTDYFGKYWKWLYLGTGILVLLLVIHFRLDYENLRLRFWKVYSRAGGSSSHKNLVRIINSVFLVIIPVFIVSGVQYNLWKRGLITYLPDFKWQLIRALVLLLAGLGSLFFIRSEEHV
jgi:hypothetical protein